MDAVKHDRIVALRAKPSKNIKQLKPTLYEYNKKAGDKGDPLNEDNYKSVGEYKGLKFLQTKQGFIPKFDPVARRFEFAGDRKLLVELVDKIGLYHEEGPKKGEKIKVGEVDWSNPNDPFFNHSELYFRAEGGMHKLDLNNPINEFLYNCLKADMNVDGGGKKNPLLDALKKYELVNISEEIQESVNDIELAAEAMAIYSNMDHDRMVEVASALGIPAKKHLDSKNPNGLKITLYKEFVMNTTPALDGKMTKQEQFIKYAKLDARDLNLMQVIKHGKSLGLINPRYKQGNFIFEGIEMIGVNNELRALEWFKEKNNLDKLESLTDKVHKSLNKHD